MTRRTLLLGLGGAIALGLGAFALLSQSPDNTVSNTVAATEEQAGTTDSSEPAQVPNVALPAPENVACEDRYTESLRELTGADSSATDEELSTLWRQRNQHAVAQLSESDNPRQWITAMRLQEEPITEMQIERLAEAVRQNPTDATLATELFDLCNGRLSNAACAGLDTTSALIRADPDNGQTWFRLAVHYANSSRDDDTLDALERVAIAPIHDTRAPQLLSQMELDLRSADSSMTYLERFFAAIGGVAKASVYGYSPLFAQCKSLSATSERWRAACLNASKRVAADTSTIMQGILGLSLQASIEEAIGEAEKSAATLARTKAIYAITQRAQELDANTLLVSDSKVLEQYIDAWMIKGELAANEQLVVSAEAAIKRGDLQPCTH